MLSSRLLGLFRLILWLAYTLPALLLAILTRFIAPYAWHRALIQCWSRGTVQLLGFHTKLQGTPLKQGACLVCNHISYMDIFVLAAVVPAHFTPKKEVASWPGVNLLTWVTEPIYLDRTRPREVPGQMQALTRLLQKARPIVLYPEGTTGGGGQVLPFKSSLFALALPGPEDAAAASPTPIQPVTLAYTHCNGVPLKLQETSPIAWIGTTPLLPHLWSVFCTKSVQVTLQFHDPITPTPTTTRKQLALGSEQAVRAGLEKALSGKDNAA